MGDQFKCSIDECRKIFLELSLFWRLSLLGFVFLLGLGCSVFVWGQAQYSTDQDKLDKRMDSIEMSLDDISFLRSQADDILDNQKLIIKYLETGGKR